jgi:hypothetical protein
MLKIPHCVDNRLADGGKIVSPTHWSRSTTQKHYFSAFSTHFYYRLSEPQGILRPEGLGKLKKCIHLIGSRTHDFPACSIVPSPLRYRVSHLCEGTEGKQCRTSVRILGVSGEIRIRYFSNTSHVVETEGLWRILWLWWALSKTPNGVGISLSKSEDGRKSSFRNFVFFSI